MKDALRLDNQLCFRLYTASRLITQAYHPLLGVHGLTYPQYLVMLVLWELDAQPVNDIARRLYLQTNTVTPLLKRMEEDGLLVRNRNSGGDARQVIVSLTEKGRALEETLSCLPYAIGKQVLCDSITPATAPQPLAGSPAPWGGQQDAWTAGRQTPLHNERKAPASPLLRAFAADTGPAAERMAALLERLDAGEDIRSEARKLADELPALMRGEPEMAAVLEEEMARAFAGEFGAAKGADGEANLEEGETALANENPYHCPKCGKFSGFNGHCDKCGYTLDAGESMKRAERLLKKAQDGTMLKPVDGLVYRSEIGQIDLEVGKRGEGRAMEHGTGLAKLEQKHPQDIPALPGTLAKGEIMPTTRGARAGGPYDPNRRAIVHGDYVAFLERKDKRRWKIATHYKDADEASRAEEVKRWLRSQDRSHLRGAAE